MLMGHDGFTACRMSVDEAVFHGHQCHIDLNDVTGQVKHQTLLDAQMPDHFVSAAQFAKLQQKGAASKESFSDTKEWNGNSCCYPAEYGADGMQHPAGVGTSSLASCSLTLFLVVLLRTPASSIR